MTTKSDQAREDAMGTGSDSRTARDTTGGSEHSPLPWHVGPHYKSDVMSREGIVAEARMLTPQGIANAEFIVRACNAHDELVAALKALTQDSRFALQIGGNPNAVAALVRQVDAALAKAEGRLR
jgi:hypothetical protein